MIVISDTVTDAELAELDRCHVPFLAKPFGVETLRAVLQAQLLARAAERDLDASVELHRRGLLEDALVASRGPPWL